MTTMTLDYEIAPADAPSPFRCQNCKTFWFNDGDVGAYDPLHRTFIRNRPDVECKTERCIINCSLFVPELLLRHTSAQFLSPDACLESTWYHGTTDESWYSSIMSNNRYVPLVHIGTYEAASERAKFISGMIRDSDPFIYEIKLDVDAQFELHLQEDVNAWPTEASTVCGPRRIIRYINRYESPGSISLLLDPRQITVTKSYQIS